MKSGRRGRRGGRRQRRREAEAKQQAQAQQASTAAETTAPVHAGSNGEAPAREAAEPAHPRPMSARELVARLEARRVEALHAAESDSAHDPAHAGTRESVGVNGTSHGTPASAAQAAAGRRAIPSPEPRRFTVAGQEWVASVAGRGTGGTGRIAQARLDAIRFSTALEPERVAAEVLVSGSNLDALYDDELAELLERGLRSRKGNG